MTDPFAPHRPRLRALAYRMLGSAADADDAVQETALRWLNADVGTVANPEAWLTRVCTRICLDMLRKRRRERADYSGPWLPEPYDEEPAADVPALAESLRLAFLLMLERLSPHERAALLLHDVFDADYSEIAAALGQSEAACRQHVSRARRRISEERERFAVAPRAEIDMMNRFASAVMSHDASAIAALIAPDAQLVSDGGGKALAARNVIHGSDRIARFFAGVARKNFGACVWHVEIVNGAPTLVGRKAGRLDSLISLAIDGERITGVYIQRNPDKLAALTRH